MASEFEYEFLEALERLRHIPYHRTDLLLGVEQELYTKLEQTPEDITGLIVFLKTQQMQGNAEKSRALAHKIWKIGGKISPYMETVYTELLLSLGLLDMGLTILQPRFAEVSKNIALFGGIFIRFALLTGNIALLDKILSGDYGKSNMMLREFADTYQRLDYGEHFKNTQRLVAETLQNHRLGFEYTLYHDRGFTDVSATYYTDIPLSQCQSATKSLNQKIEGYHTSAGIKRLYNYEVKLKNISEHPEDSQVMAHAAETSMASSPTDTEDLAKDWGL